MGNNDVTINASTENGSTRRVSMSSFGALSVDVVGPVSAFGEIDVVQAMGALQNDFVYVINDEIWTETVTGSGAISVASGMGKASTTAATSSSAIVESKHAFKYRPGQGVKALFTAIFSAPVAGSTQYIGVGTAANGFFFGYDTNGDFGVLRRNDSSETFVKQSDWNRDVMDGSNNVFNPTGYNMTDTTRQNGNVYRIDFQWLGFGMIRFMIEHPETGQFIPCHYVEYAASATTPSVRNPSFPTRMEVINTTNNTDIVMQSACMAVFNEGPRNFNGVHYSSENTKTSVGTTLTNILTLRNLTTFGGITNMVPVHIAFISAAADGTKPAVVKIVEGATLGGTPSFADFDTGNSCMQIDTAGTTVSGGAQKLSLALGKVEGKELNLHEFHIELKPGEDLTFAAQATSGTTDITISVIWGEDQ